MLQIGLVLAAEMEMMGEQDDSPLGVKSEMQEVVN